MLHYTLMLWRLASRISTQGRMTKRISLVAGYDSKGVIHDYVIHLVRCLNDISQVYYFCDNDLAEGEGAKLEGLATICGARRHGRYDFGSWGEMIDQIGWEAIAEFDELVLVNDSCYGPFYDLSVVFERMNFRPCDFWSMTGNREIAFHLQSYFLVFKRPVMANIDFQKFWSNISEEPSYENVVINYEVGLSRLLLRKGFLAATYISSKLNENLTIFPLTMIRNLEMPFLKVKCFKDPYHGSRERISLLFNHIKDNSNMARLIIEHQGRGFLSKAILVQKRDHPIYFNFGFIRVRTIRDNRLKISFFNRWRLIIRVTSKQMRGLSRMSCLHVNI